MVERKMTVRQAVAELRRDDPEKWGGFSQANLERRYYQFKKKRRELEQFKKEARERGKIPTITRLKQGLRD